MKNSNNKLTHIERLVQIDKALFGAYDLRDHGVWDIYEVAEESRLTLESLITSPFVDESQQIRELIIDLHSEWVECVEDPDDGNMDKFEILADKLESVFKATLARMLKVGSFTATIR